MATVDAALGWRSRITRAALALLAIADDPGDTDDQRLRKRSGVVAGLVTVIVPLTLPSEVGGSVVSWILGVTLSAWAVANLVVLARTHDYQRYVAFLLLPGVVFVPAATFLAGGLTGSSSGLAWAFLVPAYAILALGPHRAKAWFIVYLAMVAFMVAIDPAAHAASPAPGYTTSLIGHVVNGVVPLIIVFLLLRYTDQRRLAAEARADELLTNAIPRSIAARLRRGARRIAEAYPDTSIVFADLVGSTAWVHDTSPAQVVDLLDELFTRFDACADAAGLEKIKTIGDAYMAVAGAPTARADHAVAAVEMALAMLDAMDAVRASTGVALSLRVGIASGPVIGGVIGQRRLLFDLWGDTVNLAARMESTGISGRIQVAASTRDLLPPDRYAFEPREVEVKGLGRLTTYLLGDAPR